MKKLLILALSLALILCSVSALAETAEKEDLGNLGTLNVNGVYAIKSRIPEGYTYELYSSDELGLIAFLRSEDNSLLVCISIAYNEEYADVERLNDVDELDYSLIKESFEEMDDVTFDEKETGYGTKLLVVTDASKRFVDIYTIYKGYEHEFVLVRDNGESEVTDADVQMLVDFITDIDFIPAE